MTSEPLQTAKPKALPGEHYSTFDVSHPDKLPRSGFRYWHYAGEDDTHPGISDEARRLHGEGYQQAGLVNELAIDSTGRMASTVDKTLGLPCRYYVAVNPEQTDIRSTARKVFGDPGVDYFGLPGIRLCHEHLTASGLSSLHRHRDVGPIVEISALARSTGAGADGIHEIIRRMLVEGIADNEMFFTALVPSTLRSLQLRYGQQIWQIIGGDVPVEGEGVNAGVHLRPVIIESSRVIDTMRQEATLLEGGKMRGRLRQETDHFESVYRDCVSDESSSFDLKVSDG